MTRRDIIAGTVGALLGSLALAGAAVALEPSAAKPIRLVGDCGGRIMAAMEESDFPAGCAWIEPIRMESL